jgi:hypothetical protein
MSEHRDHRIKYSRGMIAGEVLVIGPADYMGREISRLIDDGCEIHSVELVSAKVVADVDRFKLITDTRQRVKKSALQLVGALADEKLNERGRAIGAERFLDAHNCWFQLKVLEEAMDRINRHIR